MRDDRVRLLDIQEEAIERIEKYARHAWFLHAGVLAGSTVASLQASIPSFSRR